MEQIILNFVILKYPKSSTYQYFTGKIIKTMARGGNWIEIDMMQFVEQHFDYFGFGTKILILNINSVRRV